MHDISSKFLSSSICSFFAKTDEKHGYKTRSSNSGDFYINISKTNKKLTRSFTRFEAKLWNSIPAEIHQYPKKPSKIMFMNLCYLFYKLRPFTLKHLLHSKRIRKNLVGAEQAFSLYLGHRLYFNLNQISTY